MIESSVARRYARALFSLALEGEGGGVEAVGAQVAGLASALLTQPHTRGLLQHGAAAAAQRELVEALAPNLLPVVASFLRLLVERSRLDGLQQIALSLTGMVDAHLGRVRATLTAALPLSDAEAGQVERSLAAATRKTVLLETRVDASLLGGATADVGGVLYDGSIRTQLERLREQLKA